MSPSGPVTVVTPSNPSAALDTVLTRTKEASLDKPTRGKEHLRAMVQVRLYALPEVIQRHQRGQLAGPLVGEPHVHERDALGRNWDILEMTMGDGLGADFRRIVDGLRDSFDAEPPTSKSSKLPHFQGP
jgi:hypothetical protein